MHVLNSIQSHRYILPLCSEISEIVTVHRGDKLIVCMSDLVCYLYDPGIDALRLVASYLPAPLILRPELALVDGGSYPIVPE